MPLPSLKKRALRGPSEWSDPSHPGGYHCLYKLNRQVSHKAYETSGGACRPAEDGPFPAEDCQAQCGMGQAAEGTVEISDREASSLSMLITSHKHTYISHDAYNASNYNM